MLIIHWKAQECSLILIRFRDQPPETSQHFGSNVSYHSKVDPIDSKENVLCAMGPHYQEGRLALHRTIQVLETTCVLSMYVFC